MMKLLDRDNLLSLEDYAINRVDIRQKVMAVKAIRTVKLGKNIRFLFENKETMQYQLQEILRAEKIFEPEAIEEELEAYNGLISGDGNLKAVMMIEYTDVEERRKKLMQLKGIEDLIYLQIGLGDKIKVIANEDMARSTEEKTSAVHFLRFSLNASQQQAFQAANNISLIIEHDNYHVNVTLCKSTHQALIIDLN